MQYQKIKNTHLYYTTNCCCKTFKIGYSVQSADNYGFLVHQLG